MVLSFTKTDVLGHLVDLGYSGVSEEQLDDFVRDLRRLIKFEERHGRGVADNRPTSSKQKDNEMAVERRSRSKLADSSTSSRRKTENPDEVDGAELLIRARRQQTVETTTRSMQKRTLHVGNGVEVRVGRESQSLLSEASSTSTAASASASATSVTMESTSEHSQVVSSTSESELMIRIKMPVSERLGKSRSMTSLHDAKQDLAQRPKALPDFFSSKPTTSFIRPQTQSKGALPKELKTDPVRMHQYYQQQWDKLRLPGDRSKNQLRWVVREWMMGEGK